MGQLQLKDNRETFEDPGNTACYTAKMLCSICLQSHCKTNEKHT